MLLYKTEKTPLRQFGGLASVALLHIAIAYVLLSGSRVVVTMLQQPAILKFVKEKKPPPPDAPPPPPPPKLFAPPPPFIPLPEVQVEQPPAVIQQPMIASVSNVEPEHPSAPVIERPEPKNPGRVTPPLYEFNGCEQLEYPWLSQRAREQGSVFLRLLIDADGHVLESTIVKSSGFPRLDEAARAGMALCTFKPGTVDGKKQALWKKIEYIWNLPY